MNTSEAVAVLQNNRLTDEQATALKNVLGHRHDIDECDSVVEKAIDTLANNIISPENLRALRERLRSHEEGDDTSDDDLLANKMAKVAAVLTAEDEGTIIRLLHTARQKMDARKEWSAEITFTAKLRTKVGYRFSFAEAYQAGKDNRNFALDNPQDEIECDGEEVSVEVAGDPKMAGKVAADVREFIEEELVVCDEFFADEEVVAVHDCFKAIDEIVRRIDAPDEDIFAFLESRHECLREFATEQP